MKCIAKTNRWGIKPCPNNAKCDGYCYAHHPSVVLAKLRLYQRSGMTTLHNYMQLDNDASVAGEIMRQERALELINHT